MGKISASRIPDKGLILRVHKEFLQLNVKKRAQFKNGQRNKHFSKEDIYKYPISTRKDAQHHLLRKGKSKPL